MDWFRLYHGTCTDRKIMKAAALTDLPRHLVIAAWVAVLEFASAHDDRGSLDGFDAVDLVAMIGCSREEAEGCLAAMEHVGLIADGRVAAWERRQHAGDSSAERTKRWRERKRADAGTVTCDACDVTVTSQRRHGDRPDTESESDSDSEPTSPPSYEGVSPPTDGPAAHAASSAPCADPLLPGRVDPELVKQAVEVWNRVCGDVLPRVAKLTEQRRRLLRKRLTDECGGDLAAWEAYCRRIRSTPFLCGDNDRGWRADLEFALRPSSWAKVVEGRYEGVPRSQRSPPQQHRDPFLVAAERVAKRLKLTETDDDDRTILAGARPVLPHRAQGAGGFSEPRS